LAQDVAMTRAEQGEKPAGKIRLLTLADLDRRTRAAQQAVELRDAIIADLGGEDRISTLERAMAENAAMDVAILRHLQASLLRGEPVSVPEMTSLENTFNRTAQHLGTKRRPKDVTPLDAYYDG
jgi:hypothetical protein